MSLDPVASSNQILNNITQNSSSSNSLFRRVINAVTAPFSYSTASLSTPPSIEPSFSVVDLRGVYRQELEVLPNGDPQEAVKEILRLSTNDYPIIFFTLSDGRKIEIAKQFLTDVERMGHPDRFLVDKIEIKSSPKTDEEKSELLTLLLNIANNDVNRVKQWTEIWNYRPKCHAIDLLANAISDKYKLAMAQKQFDVSILTLNTENSTVSCHLSGKVLNGTDAELDVHPINKPFEIDVKFDLKFSILEYDVQLEE